MSVFWRTQPRPEPEEEKRFAPIGTPYFTGAGGFTDVNTNSLETALQAVAIRSCVDLVCSLGSELPVHVFRGIGASKEQLPIPANLKDPAGDGQGLEDWAYQALMSWLLRGNVYGDILDFRAGRPVQVALHYPDDVTARMESGKPRWSVNGKEVDNPERFLHSRVNPVPGRVKGLSPIEFHAGTVGLGLTASRFGTQWFQDGGHPTGLLSNTEVRLDDEQAYAAKQRFLSAMRGSREPLVFGKGWSFQPISITAEESQFLATQQYSAADCCRIFGPGFAEILGYESGGSMTYANIESRATHLLVFSMNKWLCRLERLLGMLLPVPQYVIINRAGLLQSTTLDRFRAHEIALRNRWETVNEVRDLEEMSPVSWGDEPNPPTAQGQTGPDATPGGN